MGSGKTSQSRLDHVTLAVLVGIAINEAISSSGCDCSSQNALALFAGPFTRVLTRPEGFDGTGCESGTSSLRDAAFTSFTAFTIAVTTAATRPRV
jgi:hypothetical protein